jgi:hypothetical protein
MTPSPALQTRLALYQLQVLHWRMYTQARSHDGPQEWEEARELQLAAAQLSEMERELRAKGRPITELKINVRGVQVCLPFRREPQTRQPQRSTSQCLPRASKAKRTSKR